MTGAPQYTLLVRDWKEGDVLYPAARRMLSGEEASAIVEGIDALEAAIGDGTRVGNHGMGRATSREGESDAL